MRLNKFILGLLVATLVGCNQPPRVAPQPPQPPPLPLLERQGEPVQSDQLVYSLSSDGGALEVRVLATYTNNSHKHVYFERCDQNSTGPIHWVEQILPERGKLTFIPIAWGCGGGVEHGVVAPGGTLQVENLFTLKSPVPMNPEERWARFRFELRLFSEPSTNDAWAGELPPEQRRSNIFEIRY